MKTISTTLKNTQLLIALVATPLFFFQGCSSNPTDTPLNATLPSSIELYFSRASLTDVEFEQYKVTDSLVFRECGKIQRGRYLAETQDIVPLDEDLKQKLSEISAKILAENKTREFELDAPGKNSHFADPGQFYLTLANTEDSSSEKEVLKTAFSSISSPSNKLESALRTLAIALRKSAGSAPCGNRDFYGLGTR